MATSPGLSVSVFATACPPRRGESAIEETDLRDYHLWLFFLAEDLLAFFLGERFDFLALDFFLAGIFVSSSKNKHHLRAIERSRPGCSIRPFPLWRALEHDCWKNVKTSLRSARPLGAEPAAEYDCQSLVARSVNHTFADEGRATLCNVHSTSD